MKYLSRIIFIAIAILFILPVVAFAQDAEPGAAENFVLGLKDIGPVATAALLGFLVNQFNKRVLSTIWGKKAYEAVPDSVKSPLVSWLKLLVASGVAGGIGYAVAFLTPLAQYLDASGQTMVILALMGTNAYGYILEKGKAGAGGALGKLDPNTLAAVVAAVQKARS